MTGLKVNNDASTVGNHNPSDIFSPELETWRYNWSAECVLHNGPDAERRDWHYWFKKAECAGHPDGHNRNVKISCYAVFTIESSDQIWSARDKYFYRLCPAGTRCMHTLFINPKEGGPLESPVCVDEKDITQETLTPKDDSHQDLHCGLELKLPGDHYRPAPGQQPIEVLLTEQVQKIDGSLYEAPALYIRDKSSPYKLYDRVFIRDASAASTIVQVGVYRGNFIQKTYEFCFQMGAKSVAGSVVFTYSFLQVPQLRRGRIPLQIDQVLDDDRATI